MDSLTPAQIAMLLEQPAVAPPPGVEQILTLHSPDQYWWYVTIVLCMVVSGIFILLRAYTKVVVVKTIDVADYFVLIGFLGFIVLVIIGKMHLDTGSGVHLWQMRWRDLEHFTRVENYGEIAYSPTSFFIKMSVLLQYLKIFAPHGASLNRSMFYGSWTIIVANFLVNATIMFISIFQCNPRKSIWNFFIPHHCLAFQALKATSTFNIIFNMVTDIAVLILPCTTLWQMRIPTRKKVQISCLFALGTLASGASTVRIVWNFRLLKDNADRTYAYYNLGLWTFAELALVLVVSAAMSLPQLFRAKRAELQSMWAIVSGPFTWFMKLLPYSLRVKKSQGESHHSLQPITAPKIVPVKNGDAPMRGNGQSEGTRSSVHEVK